jgi:hypothetical protein
VVVGSVTGFSLDPHAQAQRTNTVTTCFMAGIGAALRQPRKGSDTAVPSAAS